MWKIKKIFECDYGCEDLSEEEMFKLSVILVNEAGEEKYIAIDPDWLCENCLDEGSIWPEELREIK